MFYRSVFGITYSARLTSPTMDVISNSDFTVMKSFLEILRNKPFIHFERIDPRGSAIANHKHDLLFRMVICGKLSIVDSMFVPSPRLSTCLALLKTGNYYLFQLLLFLLKKSNQKSSPLQRRFSSTTRLQQKIILLPHPFIG